MLKQLTYSIAACCVSALCMSAAFSQETDGQNQEPSAEAEYTDDDEGGDDKGDGGDDEPAAPLAPPPGGSASLAQVEFETRQSSPGTISALDHGLLGDRVDLATGGLSFEHVDVVLPGNSGLDVSIRRRRTQGETYLANSHEFADWEVVTPRISMYVAGNNSWRSDRCNGPHLPPTFSFFGEIVEPHEYWNGIKFSGPGVGSRTVLDRYGGDQWKSGAAGVSADYWVFECISDIGSANGGGQGFIAVAPNGDRYRLDKLIYRHARPLLKGNLMPRRHAILLATQVTDMEGNQVDYTYDSSGRLTQISGSDGREINVYYSGSGNHIDHVTANGRTWTYSYDGSPSYLTEVELPDGRSWQFDMEDLDWTPTFGDASGCKTPNKTLTVTHPDAIVGTFTIGEVTHGRTYVPDGPLPPPGGMGCEASAEANLSPKYFEVMAIKQKSLSGPGYPQASWVYSYSGDSGAYTGSGGLPDDKWTQVIDPLGRKSISYFNRRWGALEGTLTKEELYATSGAGTPVQTTEYTYIADGPLGLFDMINDNQALQNTAKHPGEITITRGSDWYRTNYTYNTDDTSSTYSYGHPLSVTRTSSVSGAARTETIEYEHDTSSWILGLTASVTRNGKLFDSFDHDALGHVIEARRFGATAFTYTYDGEGMLSSKTNALSEETVYGSYKRGIPRTVTLPDLNTITRTVDDNGWITSETTPRGDTFSYTYNDMGWLTFLGRPGAWSDTTVSYSGLGSGAMAQTSTRGAQRTITTYDSMLRPVEVQLQAISGGGGSIYTKTAYDALSRVTFTSWPSATSGPTAGVNTSYDALDRVTQTQETVSPYAMTSTAYLPGNGISVTDPEGNTTVTWLSAYGAPGNGEPILIEQPEGLSTAMSHDIYGNLLSATQGGFTQTWEYNSRLLVCRHATPETGATLYQYDAADQLIRFAEGQSASSGCPAPPSAERVVNTYDDRGRLVHVNYPNGTPDISIIYDANGNMTQNTRGGAVWDYTYNELDLVETETLTIDGRTYLIGHGYNNDGAVTSQTYPSGITVAFAPDGLGRPTGASAGGTDYADNAAYHPSGALSGFVYGDGHVYTAGFDARQMLASQSTSLSGTALTDFAYTRDSNGRILSITDYAVPGQNRSYTYDDLGRLETASGPWGTGSYSYDGANNLVAKTLGARLVEIDMDGGNRVERVRDSAAGGWQAWSHDARGNVTSNGAVNLTYDRANQPVTLSGAASGSFTYDGHFRRVRQVVDGETIYSVYSLAGQLVHRDFASQGCSPRAI